MGHHPPSDEFRSKEDLDKPVVTYPLKVNLCLNCGLSQLNYVVPSETLYQHDYPYESSITETGKEHYFRFAKEVSDRFKINDRLVVDIGSNVGVLLEGFKKYTNNILGIDPASNIVDKANSRGIETICGFFNTSTSEDIKKTHGKASIITACNVFAHINDLKEFMNGVVNLLEDNGIFIFESPDMLSLINGLAYDTIYHEHLSYLSLKPVVQFCRSLGLEVFDVESWPIHGGSFRVFISHKDIHKVEDSVNRFLAKELEGNIHNIDIMKWFATKVSDNRFSLRSLLQYLKDRGKTIALLSTPAKGMSLINYCKLGTETFDFATEKSQLKIGRYTPGGHIPILDDTSLLSHMPDYALLLAWNFAPEIMKNNNEYKQRGGKFIIPIPEPIIV